MDTSKIMAFRHASQAILLLESLLASARRIPRHARRVADRSALPSVLQRIAIRGAKSKVHWAAWSAASSIWFFTVEVTPPPSGVPRCPAIKVMAYDEKGALKASGVWANIPKRGWQRCVL
jgi:hypothetical protein